MPRTPAQLASLHRPSCRPLPPRSRLGGDLARSDAVSCPVDERRDRPGRHADCELAAQRQVEGAMVRQARAVRLEPRRVADPRCTASAVCAVPDAAEPTWRRITRARRGAGARCAVGAGRAAVLSADCSVVCAFSDPSDISLVSTVSRVSLSVAISFGPTTAEPEDSKYFMYEYDTGYSRRSYRYSLHLYSSASSRLRAPATAPRGSSGLRPPRVRPPPRHGHTYHTTHTTDTTVTRQYAVVGVPRQWTERGRSWRRKSRNPRRAGA